MAVRNGPERVFVPAIDGFRAYAILGVVLIHLLLVSGVVAAGRDGLLQIAIWGLFGNAIDAFFIVSGFVLFLPTVVRGGDFGSLRRYAVGRAARLLPAYWLVLALAYLLLALAPPWPGLGAPALGDAAVHLAALQMPARLLDPALAPGFGIDGPLWMISVIAGFYVLLPMVAAAYHRHPLLGLALAAAVTLGWKELALGTDLFDRLAGSDAPSWAIALIATDQLPGWAFSFALGMTGAWLYVQARRRVPADALARGALILLPVAILAYLAFAYLYGQTAEPAGGPVSGSLARSEPLEAMGSSLSRAGLMAAVVLGPLWLQRPFVNTLVSRLAGLSYGIYLIHMIAIAYVLRLLGLPTDGTAAALGLWVAAVLPASVLYAAVARRLVERPIADRARGWERSGGGRRPAPGALGRARPRHI